jgi:hypothetical protein
MMRASRMCLKIGRAFFDVDRLSLFILGRWVGLAVVEIHSIAKNVFRKSSKTRLSRI